jgi:hypothetical protein
MKPTITFIARNAVSILLFSELQCLLRYATKYLIIYFIEPVMKVMQGFRLKEALEEARRHYEALKAIVETDDTTASQTKN